MEREPEGCTGKKLTDAARHWVRGGSSLEGAIADLEALGAPEDVIAEMRQRQRGEDFEVWQENWPAVEMFLRLETQWRVGMGGPTGLDYVAARWLFEVYEVTDQRALLERLKLMEGAALTAMAEGNA